jgi:hypothetical protein
LRRSLGDELEIGAAGAGARARGHAQRGQEEDIIAVPRPPACVGTARWVLFNDFDNMYGVERIHVLSDRIGAEARVNGPVHKRELQRSWPGAETLRHRLSKATVIAILELDTLRCEGDRKLISPVKMLNLFCRCIADGLGG